MSDQRTFAMFCTIDDVALLFAEVADEVATVQAFKDHVALFGDNHIPHIHIEPMRAEWGLNDILSWPTVADLDREANLFRQPAQVSS